MNDMTVTHTAESWEFSSPAPNEVTISLETIKANVARRSGRTMMDCTNDGIVTFNDRRGCIDYQITGWRHPYLVATLINDYRK